MKIVVIGGSGLIGSKLAAKLIQLEHTVIVASPTSGINTITGDGLNEALKGADVVVDVSNSRSFDPKVILDFFQRSTMNLLTAEIYSGVKHHIGMSVVGADRLPGNGFLRGKFEQEELVKESGIPYSILRSTQLFESTGRMIQAGTVGEEIHVPPVPIQPVAADEVIAILKDIILAPPLNNTIEIAGPERMPMTEYLSYYLNVTDDPRLLVPDEHALYFGAELKENSLIPGRNALLGKIRYDEWFPQQLTLK